MFVRTRGVGGGPLPRSALAFERSRARDLPRARHLAGETATWPTISLRVPRPASEPERYELSSADVRAGHDVRLRSATPSLETQRSPRSSSSAFDEANLFLVPLDRPLRVVPLSPLLRGPARPEAFRARAPSSPGAPPAGRRLVRGARRPRVCTRACGGSRRHGSGRAAHHVARAAGLPERPDRRRRRLARPLSTRPTRRVSGRGRGRRLDPRASRPAGRGRAVACCGRAAGCEGPLARRDARPSRAVDRALRAALCRDGVEQMLHPTRRTPSSGLPAESEWRPTALLLQGAATCSSATTDHGDAVLAGAVDAAESLDATATRVTAISERAVVAASRNDHAAARVARARGSEPRRERPVAGITRPAARVGHVCPRALLRHSRWAEARAELHRRAA